MPLTIIFANDINSSWQLCILTLKSTQESFQFAEERIKHTGCACTAKLTLSSSFTRLPCVNIRVILNSLQVANFSPASKTITFSYQTEFLKQITTVLSWRFRLASPRHCNRNLQPATATCYLQRYI